jgi:hypothetical protein
MLPSRSGRTSIPKCGRPGEIASRAGIGMLARREQSSRWHDAIVHAMRLSRRKLPIHEIGAVQTILEGFETTAGSYVVPVSYFFNESSGSLRIIGHLTTAILVPQINQRRFR